MAEQRNRYTPEFKEEAVKMVLESSRPVAEIARELHINDGTLGNWVNLYRKEHPVEEEPLVASERARLRELEKENQDLRMKAEFLGKIGGLLRPGVSVSARYAFIDAERDNYPVARMCVWARVSRSGYYEWRGRTDPATAARRRLLAGLVEAVFGESDRTYGYRRVHASLARSGHVCCPELVRSIMRELGLVPCQPRPFRPTTTQSDGTPPAPDLVGRDFTAAEPGTKLVGDITYLPTAQGWVYLATVLDCCTKACIGYAVAEHMRTGLVVDALAMASRRYPFAKNAIFHSDRGSQYTSIEFAKAARRMSIRRSVGKTGVCFDNALAESFNAALKVERVNRTSYPTRESAREDVTRYIEFRYNRIRLHSALGYKTPQEVYEEHRNTQQAA
ncbi:MAG: IS3 family transposase [Nocardioidaceae bacterium]